MPWPLKPRHVSDVAGVCMHVSKRTILAGPLTSIILKPPKRIKWYLPAHCNQCNNPPCVQACPVKATWKQDDGVVIVDYDRWDSEILQILIVKSHIYCGPEELLCSRKTWELNLKYTMWGGISGRRSDRGFQCGIIWCEETVSPAKSGSNPTAC
jgi:ferredoxin-like protein FixX